MSRTTKLLFFTGKMAAGKSTLSRELAKRENAVLLCEDEFLVTLYPGEIVTLTDYVRCSTRIRSALAPHIRALLSRGVSVVLDFPGNTRTQRAWFRHLLDGATVEHELHFIDASDALCKQQLRARSAGRVGSAWTTDEEFDLVTAHFEPPTPEEGFNVIQHERA